MYKVLLVDDEAGVRNSIKAKINWEAVGFKIEYEASGGEEALRILHEQPLPDLVISDIRMPQMDGIAFIAACKERYPLLRTVVLSGYSDFEYTKAAIRLGVKDYLLKPVARSELTDLLGRLAAEIEEDVRQRYRERIDQIQSRQHLSILQEQMMLQLVHNEMFDADAVKERLYQLQLSSLAADDLSMQFIAAEMRIPPGRLGSWEEREDLLQLSYQMLGRELADLEGRIFSFQDVSHPSMLHMLIMLDDRRKSEEYTLGFVNELKRKVKRLLRLDSVIGIGEPFSGMRELKNGYASSMLSWSQSTIEESVPSGSLRTTEMMNVMAPETERKLMAMLESLDLAAFKNQIQALLPTDRDMPTASFTFMTFRIIQLFNAVAKKFELGDSSLQKHLLHCQLTIWSHSSRERIVEQLDELTNLVTEEVRKTRFTGGQKLIEAIVQYVDENYCYELTLSGIAAMFHLNETYLSGLFKQHAGLTFSDYVTKLRMEKAEQLLQDGVLKLTDIAMLVGYSSASYFSTSFKKYYGMSPKEYRERRTDATR
jgi:two-component system, response regulator YesN